MLHYENLLEESIRLAATAAAAFLDRGIIVSLTTNGRDIITQEPLSVPEGSGAGHMRTLNETLARIDLGQDAAPIGPICESLIAQTRSQDYLILISTYQREDLQDLLRRLPGKADSFLWLIPLERSMEFKVAGDLARSALPWYVNK